MKKKAEELKKTYENLDEGAKKHMSKLEELITKNAMTQDQVNLMIDNALKAADQLDPELESLEGMSSREYAELYKKMSEEVKASPEKYEGHVKASGMNADDLAILFMEINGTIVRYPEVWESREAAEMLHPRNLAILINAFKKEK